MRPSEYIGEKFWPHVDRTKPFGCWIWLGARDVDKYGTLYIDRKKERAHRIAWIITYGAPKPGYLVCHKCDNPSCVNPHHLFQGTSKMNFDDALCKGRITRFDPHDATICDTVWATSWAELLLDEDFRDPLFDRAALTVRSKNI